MAINKPVLIYGYCKQERMNQLEKALREVYSPQDMSAFRFHTVSVEETIQPAADCQMLLSAVSGRTELDREALQICTIYETGFENDPQFSVQSVLDDAKACKKTTEVEGIGLSRAEHNLFVIGNNAKLEAEQVLEKGVFNHTFLIDSHKSDISFVGAELCWDCVLPILRVLTEGRLDPGIYVPGHGKLQATMEDMRTYARQEICEKLSGSAIPLIHDGPLLESKTGSDWRNLMIDNVRSLIAERFLYTKYGTRMACQNLPNDRELKNRFFAPWGESVLQSARHTPYVQDYAALFENEAWEEEFLVKFVREAKEKLVKQEVKEPFFGKKKAIAQAYNTYVNEQNERAKSFAEVFRKVWADYVKETLLPELHRQNRERQAIARSYLMKDSMFMKMCREAFHSAAQTVDIALNSKKFVLPIGDYSERGSAWDELFDACVTEINLTQEKVNVALSGHDGCEIAKIIAEHVNPMAEKFFGRLRGLSFPTGGNLRFFLYPQLMPRPVFDPLSLDNAGNVQYITQNGVYQCNIEKLVLAPLSLECAKQLYLFGNGERHIATEEVVPDVTPVETSEKEIPLAEPVSLKQAMPSMPLLAQTREGKIHVSWLGDPAKQRVLRVVSKEGILEKDSGVPMNQTAWENKYPQGFAMPTGGFEYVLIEGGKEIARKYFENWKQADLFQSTKRLKIGDMYFIRHTLTLDPFDEEMASLLANNMYVFGVPVTGEYTKRNKSIRWTYVLCEEDAQEADPKADACFICLHVNG